MRKLVGGLLMAVSLAGAFVAIGAFVGWGTALAVSGALAGIVMLSTGWAMISEKPDHPWDEMNH